LGFAHPVSDCRLSPLQRTSADANTASWPGQQANGPDYDKIKA